MNKKVSILIPAYNSEKFIAETLRSCVEQTYTDIEIVIVDDGSTDRTLNVAREWEAKYPFITVFSQPNQGACVARNLAFEKSTGDYVMWLDADDVISQNKIELQIEALERTADSLAVATGSWDRFYGSTDDATFPHLKIYRNYPAGMDLLVDMWMNSEMFGNSCYLVPRELARKAGPWLPGLKMNQDGEFFARVLANASNVVFCPEAKLYYRSGLADSVSKPNSESKIRSLLDSYLSYQQTALAIEDSPRVRLAITRVLSLFMYLYYGTYTDLALEAKQIIKAMGMKPLPAGTKRTKMISQLIGLENFLKLRKLIAKY